ncbi:MAG: HAMP domain-containing histidine kinase [Myxococcales bacterium]|nr:HAMP domain-containing histidine kinase [Myxococcales bacterium]
MALGVWLVGRPMRRLVEKARRVGEGDFNTPLELRQHDELGALATEMNAMCERLVVATGRADAEAEARIAALEQLRHADRLTTVGKLASGIAHELGTPLNVVSGRARMIITGEAEGQEVIESAEVIVSASRRMTTIIRQLLDFARRRGPQKAEEDVHEVVRRALSLISHLMEKRGVSLELVGGTAVAELDTTQIEQVVTNLVVNGAQAMASGGLLTVVVRKRSAIAPPDVDRAGAPRQWVAIAVVDQGPGIPAEDLPHIFEPFYTTKGVGEGTGLGLSVAYGIVQEHGGFITVESHNRGTVFTVHLPAGGDP